MITFADYKNKKDELSTYLRNVGGKLSLKKETSNLFRNQDTTTKKIDVSKFNNVISIDTENLTADVEGMTTYETLVNETLAYSLLPAVVPQLKTITIGGAATGIGIEASSFRYGFAHETVIEMEILLGSGEVVVCNKNQNSDLFYGFPNSYGTFGYAIRLKIKLIPSKKFVALKHDYFDNTESYFQALEKNCALGVDFVDGVIFSPNEMYITTGKFTDVAPFTSDYTYMNIYYKSIREKKMDYLTVSSFIWRWDTDWFWCSKHFGVQNNLIRKLWGKKRLNSRTYWKIQNIMRSHPLLQKIIGGLFKRKEAVIQDIEVPIDNAPLFAEFFHKKIGIKPIWICPVRQLDKNLKFDLYKLDPEKIYVNFGFWDTVLTTEVNGYYNKLIETKVSELNGKKSLYSESFYTEKQFWTLYDKKIYHLLKMKYDQTHRFKDLYQKTVVQR